MDEAILLKAKRIKFLLLITKLLKRNEITAPEEFIIQNNRPHRNITKHINTNSILS